LRLPKAGTEKISSGIYRFNEHDRNIKVEGDLSSSNLIFSTQTQNPERQYGLDGLVFDSKGYLYVGDFGDAIIYQLQLNPDGTLARSKFFAQLPKSVGIDGLAIDKQDNLYLAGFLRNQIYKVSASAEINLVAEYPDNDGSNGAIDQPADVIVWGEKLLISNFDLMKGVGIVNSAHSKPYTISYIDL
ncbi:SMP-30/gluconolactonase/LRE family protein, partial [Pedobacter sp.]|uniref:SMP-30/gluconolactonase/LRE family protein n=1 Tax=Pedobacter sp. TaxID=1411316 RepID=UPI003C677620